MSGDVKDCYFLNDQNNDSIDRGYGYGYGITSKEMKELIQNIQQHNLFQNAYNKYFEDQSREAEIKYLSENPSIAIAMIIKVVMETFI